MLRYPIAGKLYAGTNFINLGNNDFMFYRTTSHTPHQLWEESEWYRIGRALLRPGKTTVSWDRQCVTIVPKKPVCVFGDVVQVLHPNHTKTACLFLENRIQAVNFQAIGVARRDGVRCWAAVPDFEIVRPTQVFRGRNGGYLTRSEEPKVVPRDEVKFTPLVTLRDIAGRRYVRHCCDGNCYSVAIREYNPTGVWRKEPYSLQWFSHDDNWVIRTEFADFPPGFDITDFDVSPDGRTLAVADAHKMVLRLYDYAADRKSLSLRVEYDIPCYRVSFSPDGLTLATLGPASDTSGAYNSVLTVMDVDT